MANLSNKNFRINEIEQKSDFTNVIRASNYDSKFYLNDKDAPVEDVELVGGNPPIPESSWSNRFFFLPTRLCSSLAEVVGTQTRWGQNPTGNYRYNFRNGRNAVRYGYDAPTTGNVWTETRDNVKMQSFAVTTDPALVPLQETILDCIQTGNLDDAWPNEPSYRYWNGSELRIAAYHSSTMGTPWPGTPDTVFDERGPFEYFEFFHPWAFFVYEMRNITSINGAQFVCAGRQQYEGICPVWLRNSIGANHSLYTAYSPTGWGPFTNCHLYSNLGPYCAYVLRPSTGAIVGWLAFDTFGTVKGAVNPPSPLVLPSPVTESEEMQWYYTYGWYNNVTGIQTGDLLVWEWWSFTTGNVWMMNRDAVTSGLRTPTNHIRTHLGGGLPGQPLTKNGTTGKPNWAPAHRSDLSAMTGYRPR